MKAKQLTQFRGEVYQNFKNCRQTDMLMDLMDALTGNTTARSVVELSLNSHFRRHYTALNKAVAVNALTDQQLASLACQTISTPVKRKFHMLGTDVTSNPCPFANTLPDRGFVYQPHTNLGNKPIAIGHQNSFWAGLPEYLAQKNGKLGGTVVYATEVESGEQGDGRHKTTL